MGITTPFVIMVDDDKVDAFTTKKAFDRCAFETVFLHLQSGEELFDYLAKVDETNEQSGNARPDVILLDVSMPRMGGYEVLNLLRADDNWRDLPVVMLTTSDEPEHVKESYERGANSHIVKPSSISDMDKFAESFSGYWFRLVQLPNAHAGTPRNRCRD